MKTNYFYYFLALMVLIFSVLIFSTCTEKANGPISESIGKPDPVAILDTKPIPGGAVVTYRIPQSEDILFVKAVYTLANGRTLENTASFYENSMALGGFSDMLPHEAQFFVVNRALVESDPVTVSFTPLEASFLKAAKTVEIVPAFGGVQYSWENPDSERLIFEFFAQDSVGRLSPVSVMSSSSKEVKTSLRGYEPVERIFAAVVRDKWDNVSDTIYPESKYIVPLYETTLDKSIMNVMNLDNDSNWSAFSCSYHGILDGNWSCRPNSTAGHTDNNTLPATLTIDLGKKVKLSRFKYRPWHITEPWYGHATARFFELWACYDTPSKSGNWDEWTKVMDCATFKPSGTYDQPGFMSDEDLAYALSGFEYELDLDVPAFRYFRLFIIKNFENTTFASCSELDFFGQVVE